MPKFGGKSTISNKTKKIGRLVKNVRAKLSVESETFMGCSSVKIFGLCRVGKKERMGEGGEPYGDGERFGGLDRIARYGRYMVVAICDGIRNCFQNGHFKT